MVTMMMTRIPHSAAICTFNATIAQYWVLRIRISIWLIYRSAMEFELIPTGFFCQHNNMFSPPLPPKKKLGSFLLLLLCVCVVSFLLSLLWHRIIYSQNTLLNQDTKQLAAEFRPPWCVWILERDVSCVLFVVVVIIVLYNFHRFVTVYFF